MRRLNISIPKPVGIIKVQIPASLAPILHKKFRRGEISLEDKDTLGSYIGEIKWGLAMEVIESDLSLVSQRRIRYYIWKEYEKMEKYGIILGESSPTANVLWGSKKKKLYFIDLDDWIILANMF